MSRNWARGAPPPRGSIEYVGVGDMFEPEPSRTASGKIWEISATEVEAANRWNETLARSVLYARRVHGDHILSAADAKDFAAYYKRWKAFSGRVTTLSLYDRALEENKRTFEDLLIESKRFHDRFTKKGMAVIPVPHMAELTLLLRTMPKKISPPEMIAKLRLGITWAKAMILDSITTGEWVQKSGYTIAAVSLLGPAGLLIAYLLPTSWTKDRKGLEAAIASAKKAIPILEGADAQKPFTAGEPVYDEFLRRLARIYIEAAGLYGVMETRSAAAAEAIDRGTGQAEKAPTSLLWMLMIAGISYLGLRWVYGPREQKIMLAVPDAVHPEPPPDYYI